MPRRNLLQLYRADFSDYSWRKFRDDFLAGITVAAVALPLALAFGIASGATPAAGLVTAIICGIVIGALSGAPYQISGPTGAMSAILIVLTQQYGLQGVWIAGLMAGCFLLLVGFLKLGRLMAFIPSPVITGFTSGIALIITIQQIDNFLGVKTPAADTALQKLVGYTILDYQPNLANLLVGLGVILLMVCWPKKLALRFPASLAAIILASLACYFLDLNIPLIGEIPKNLLLDERLHLQAVPWQDLHKFLAPALTIAALGGIESLLCGAVGSNMTGIRLQANQELIAQGVGNILVPFFGGVPATAAIARSSVGIKSGGRTRLVSIIHALIILASVFILGPLMALIPLAALAAVLIVTAFHMNEWESIHYIFIRRFKTAMLTFFLTMFCTVALDLTEAILIGFVISALVFLSQISSIDIFINEVSADKLRQKGIDIDADLSNVRVAYVIGPLFFAAVGHFNEAFSKLDPKLTLILSMRGMPFIDISGIQAILALNEKLQAAGGKLLLAAVHEDVRQMFERGGLIEEVGQDALFWSSDRALASLKTAR